MHLFRRLPRAIPSLLLLLLAGCAGTPPAAPDAQLLALRDMLAGRYDSAEQAQQDPDYFAISLLMTPIWQERQDGPWLYVEQATMATPERPYRQRVYQLALEQGRLASRVYTLPGDPLSWAGAEAAAFARLDPAELELRDGCTVYLRAVAGGYEGGTEGKACASDLRGASYATSVVRLSADRLESWDQGFDAADKQVWGATAGGYVFVKRP